MMMIKTYSQGTDTSLSERKKKKLQKRIERLQNNLRRERKNHKLHIELGDSYALLEDMESAEKFYVSAIDILHQGDVDERARKQIIVLYGKILNIVPDNYDAYTKLGEEYVAAGQKEKASRFLLSSGKKAFENGDYELALQCYEQVIDLGKSNPYIIERCTEIFLKLDRKDDAIENYVKIGDMYAREEKAVEALEYYKKASALDPESPDLTLKVARMYYTLEWTENAAAEMVKIAEYHEQQKNFAEALKYFQHSLSLDRENDRALAGKLRITASKGMNGSEGSVSAAEKESQEDILKELDLIEDALKTQNFAKMEEKKRETADEAERMPSAEPPLSEETLSAEPEERENNVIDATEMFSNGQAPAQKQPPAPQEAEAFIPQSPEEEEDSFQLDREETQASEGRADTEPKEQRKKEAVVWQDRLLDLNLEEDFVLMTGLNDQNGEDSPAQVPDSDEEKSLREEDKDTTDAGPQIIEVPLPKAESKGEAEKPLGIDFPPSTENETEDVELFESLDLHPLEEDPQQKEDIFEPAELTAATVPGTGEETPLEDTQFETFAKEEQAEEVDSGPNVVQATEEKSSDAQAASASPEADRLLEEDKKIEEEAEKLIEETLLMTNGETPQVSESDTGEKHIEEDVIEIPIAETTEEPQPENLPEEASAEPTPEKMDGMPPTYTPIKKPEKIPRPPFEGTVPELEQRLEDLEKQLENTEEEKYFLQEQFTAQISKLKSRETQLKREYERSRKDKDDLQQRLEEITSIYESSRQKGEESDEARYEAIVNKIQRKKQALQEHVNKLLKQREQNGRFLAEELKSLGSTKQRLQHNLEYIQQVKARVEQKIQTDLRQAQEEVEQLSSQAIKLEQALTEKRQSEQQLHDQFDKLQKEKDMLQDQFTETISALTKENEKTGEQLKELSKEKLETEHLLKKKFKTLHLSYQRLKSEYKTSVHSKEMELNRTAQRLSQFADEYVKLETTLKDIRKERDKLERMLAQETATRERLEDNLTDIESQVNSLEAQGSELLEQLGQELDHQLMVKQNTTDEFQGSLGELEQLLALQEKEIQSLEVL